MLPLYRKGNSCEEAKSPMTISQEAEPTFQSIPQARTEAQSPDGRGCYQVTVRCPGSREGHRGQAWQEACRPCPWSCHVLARLSGAPNLKTIKPLAHYDLYVSLRSRVPLTCSPGLSTLLPPLLRHVPGRASGVHGACLDNELSSGKSRCSCLPTA